MKVAQSLYEAGHITYMRTDSTNLSNDALGEIGSVVEDELREELPPGHGNSPPRPRGPRRLTRPIRPSSTWPSRPPMSGGGLERDAYGCTR